MVAVSAGRSVVVSFTMCSEPEGFFLSDVKTPRAPFLPNAVAAEFTQQPLIDLTSVHNIRVGILAVV